MKRCSTCNRTYTDPNLSFCIEDGTPLTTINYEDETTVVSPRSNENDWNATAYQPPGSYVPPGTDPGRPRRRVWPWVLGIAGAFILGIVALSIAAVVLAPRLMRSARNQQREAPPPVQQREIPNTNTSPENANVAVPPVNANANANESVAVAPPADRDLVLGQLTDLENDWTVANLNADKKALERILADDYVGPTNEGELQTKADYIRTIQRDTTVDKWDFDDLKVTLTGDRATLTGKITYQTKDEELEFDFTDKFVWRDGRWQATGSQVKRRE
jgi:hypothetical protein